MLAQRCHRRGWQRHGAPGAVGFRFADDEMADDAAEGGEHLDRKIADPCDFLEPILTLVPLLPCIWLPILSVEASASGNATVEELRDRRDEGSGSGCVPPLRGAPRPHGRMRARSLAALALSLGADDEPI